MKSTFRRVAGMLGAGALVGAAVVATPLATAVAADNVVNQSSITVTSTSGSTPLQQYQNVDVSFAFDTTGKPVAEGDTFSVTYPAGFAIASATFPVLDTASGSDIANCTVAPTANSDSSATVSCAFTSFVTTHSPVRGTVSTTAQLNRAQDASTVTFEVGGTTVTVGLPGGGGIKPSVTPPLASPNKGGWMTDAGQTTVHWVVNIPGTSVPRGATIHLVDHLPASVGDPTNLEVLSTANVNGWAETGTWTGVSHTIASQSGGLLDVVIPANAINSSTVYRIQYDTPIIDRSATSFTNNATVVAQSLTSTVTKQTSGQGSGQGSTPTPTPTPTVTTTAPTTAPVTTSETTTAETTPVPTTVTATTTVPQPSVTILKKDAAGNHVDSAANAVSMTTDTEGLVFTITNNGPEALKSILVSDVSSGGTVSGLNCAFPDESLGVSWTGPFAVGAKFTCTATLSGMVPGATHSDTATVKGVGVGSNIEVTSSDSYFANRPNVGATTGNAPVGSLGSGSLNPSGSSNLGSLAGPGALLLGSAAIGSAGIAAACYGLIPLPASVLALLPPMCPVPRVAATTGEAPPVAPGPEAPNGRG